MKTLKPTQTAMKHQNPLTKKEVILASRPDIVAEKEGRKHYFELSLKSEKPRLLKSKWLFLNTLSTLKSQQFRLITTKGHYKFTNEMLR